MLCIGIHHHKVIIIKSETTVSSMVRMACVRVWQSPRQTEVSSAGVDIFCWGACCWGRHRELAIKEQTKERHLIVSVAALPERSSVSYHLATCLSTCTHGSSMHSLTL